jgi:hypothetical protein
MRNEVYELVKTFNDVTHAKYGDYSYSAGYLSSMVSGMIDEMRIRGTKDMKDMANYYERLLQKSIINITTEVK